MRHLWSKAFFCTSMHAKYDHEAKQSHMPTSHQLTEIICTNGLIIATIIATISRTEGPTVVHQTSGDSRRPVLLVDLRTKSFDETALY
jgi:hypothetical protein